MKRPSRALASSSLSTLALGAALAALAGCSQGEGEACQVNADCSGDLICNAGTQLCQRPGSVPDDPEVDARTAVDAAPPDAEPADAATPDAGPMP